MWSLLLADVTICGWDLIVSLYFTLKSTGGFLHGTDLVMVKKGTREGVDDVMVYSIRVK